MSELGQAASRIGEKIVDILDVFDLSFFISGAVAIAAAMVAFPEHSLPLLGASDPSETSGAVLFGLVLGSYVVGLVCFSIGRPLRDGIVWISHKLKIKPTPSSFEIFQGALEQHLGARSEGDAQGKDALHRLFGYDVDRGDRSAYSPAYTRMWAHVRSYPELRESFTLLKRYWILAASYDGIAVASLLWLLPVWVHRPGDGSVAALVLTLALGAAAVFCWFRALLYKRYQIEEIVATTVHWLALVGRPTLTEIERGDEELRQLRLRTSADARQD